VDPSRKPYYPQSGSGVLEFKKSEAETFKKESHPIGDVALKGVDAVFYLGTEAIFFVAFSVATEIAGTIVFQDSLDKVETLRKLLYVADISIGLVGTLIGHRPSRWVGSQAKIIAGFLVPHSK